MSTKIIDHKGQEFNSLSDLCKHYSIARTTYFNRRKRNWDIEKTLTTPLFETAGQHNQKAVKDHLGNVYPSVTEMLKHYGLSESMYRGRKSRQWTLEQILTTPTTVKTITDHKGNVFTTTHEMCEYWHIKYETYMTRRYKLGYSLERALTAELSIRRTKDPIQDPYGNLFKTQKALADAYGIGYTICTAALKNHSMIEALRIIPKLSIYIKNYRFDNHLEIKHCINNESDNKLFMCVFDNHEIIMTYDQIIDYCSNHLPEDKNPMRKTSENILIYEP